MHVFVMYALYRTHLDAIRKCQNRSVARTELFFTHTRKILERFHQASITKTCLFKYTEKLITEKLKIFRQKIQIFFIFLLRNIDFGYSLEPPRRGGSNEYPQSMFLSRNKKNNVYPYKPQFYYIKVGFKGVKII